MSEKQIQERKLNIFQKIRKYFYLRNVDEQKALQYEMLPEYLKSDIDVIDTVVQTNEELINKMSIGNIERLISSNPELIQHLDNLKIVAKVLDKMPETGKYINNENYIYNLAYENGLNLDKSFIKHLSTEMQLKLISKNNTYKNYSTEIERVASKESIGFEKFSDDIVKEYIIRLTEKAKRDKNYEKYDKRDFINLKKETQLEFLRLSNNYSSKVSPEVLKEYVGDNPLLFNLLPEELKIEKLKKNPDLFKKLTIDEKRKLAEIDSFKLMKKDVQNYSLNPVEFDINEFYSYEELKNYLMKMRSKYIWSYKKFKQIKDDEFIWEVSKFDPNILKSDKTEIRLIKLLYEKSKIDGNNNYISEWFEEKIDVDLLQKLDIIPEKLLSISQNYSTPFILELVKNQEIERLGSYLPSDLLEEIKNNANLTNILQQEETTPERIHNFIKKADEESFKNSINMLSKLLTNDDIIKNVSQESIIEYIENPTHDKLVEIVEKTYGEKSAQILKDRPRIEIGDIPNMYIFHPDIINEFSIGAVHATLSYYMNASYEFSELARNPEKMQEYREFSRLTNGLFNDTAVDLDKKLVMFEHSRELLANMRGIKFTDEQIDNLKLAINDYSNYKEQNVISFPSTIEELNNYGSNRREIYDEAIEKLSDKIQIKNAICQRFFGIDYTNDRLEKILNDLTGRDMCKFYQLGKFVNREETLESGAFSQEELDMLEVLDIIMSVNDPNVLKEISAELSENENLMNPITYQQLKQKVPKQYSQDFVDNLMNPQQLEEAVKQGIPGVRMREEEGIKIITLDGIDFNGYVTNPFLNNSRLHIYDSSNKNLVKIWNEMENGIATISGCPISSKQPKSTINGISAKFGLGFSQMDSMQIVVMNSDDAGVTHNKKSLDIIAKKVKFDYIDDLNEKTRKRIDEMGVSLASHEYGEVTMLRVERNLSKISSGTHGGRVNPNYIYAYGNGIGTEGIVLAKEFGLKYIIEYNPEAYIDKEVKQVKSEKKELPKTEKSNFIKGIREIMGEDKYGER